MFRSRTNGFTVIEMLVVAAVIIALAAVVVINGTTARAKSRDVKRVSDLEQIALTLRLYAEQYGEFPCEDVAECDSPLQTMSLGGYTQIGNGDHIDTLIQPYMPNVPQDPRHGEDTGFGVGWPYSYYYDGYKHCDIDGDGVMEPDEYSAIVFTFTETNKYQDASALCDLGLYGVHLIILGRSADTY